MNSQDNYNELLDKFKQDDKIQTILENEISSKSLDEFLKFSDSLQQIYNLKPIGEAPYGSETVSLA